MLFFTWGELALIMLGLGGLGAGLVLLLPDPPCASRLSHPTRLSSAVVLLVIGYHLMIWSRPESLTPLQFPRGAWWLVLGIAAVWVGGSVLLDSRQRARGRRPVGPPG